MNPASLADKLNFYLRSDPIVLFEAALVAAALFLSILLRKRPRLLHTIDEAAVICGAHKARAMLGVFAATLLLHGVVAFFLPARHPLLHDEFSYLLSADTFLHGRASNPPHPMWEHFETIHVLSQPTYSSMYPPLQGLILAGGKLLTGHPLAGAWICSAILCSLTYWMLTAWVPARWAFLGASFCILRVGLLSYWANSYWGAAHAAIGGVLLLGAIPGIVKRPGRIHAVPVGLGLLVLANSRPFEGLMFAFAMTVLTGFKFMQTREASVKKSFCLIAPLCLGILIPGALATTYYNRQVTGNGMRTPQQENMTQYGLAMLPWQSMHAERIPRVKHMQAFYDLQRERFRQFHTPTGFLKNRFKALCQFWSFFASPLLTPPLILFLYRWRGKRCFPLLIAGLIFSTALIINPWYFPHYFAPAFGLLWLVAVKGLRVMHGFRVANSGSRPFLLFVRLVPLCMTAAVVVSVAGTTLSWLTPPSDESKPTWHYTGAGNTQRDRLVSQLEALPGKHLVLVSYADNRNLAVDWVYNGADIDGARVVFAHDFGDSNNRDLLRYYSDRQVWAVNIDQSPDTVRKLR